MSYSPRSHRVFVFLAEGNEMETAPSVPVDLAFVRLSAALKQASKRIPFSVESEMVYAHRCASVIGEEPDEEICKVVPRSHLQNEVMRGIELLIRDLKPHAHCAVLDLGEFAVDGVVIEPEVDMRLMLRMSFLQTMGAQALIYRYYYKVAAETDGQTYLSGTFDLHCRPR